MKNSILALVVFLCGAMVMVYEIVGSRVVGPYVGTSLFVWTSLIGVILLSLSMGYWIGGYLADKWPEARILAWIILLSALLVLLTTLLKERVLTYLVGHFTDLRVNSVIGAIVLFAPAALLLGMVSPYAVRLSMKEVSGSGKTVGRLYAISTIGSIAGTFAAGFWLIPAMGHKNVLFLVTFILSACAMMIFVSGRKIPGSVAGILFMLLLSWFFFKSVTRTYAYIDTDSSYNRILIYDSKDYETGKDIKILRINDERSSAIFRDSSGIVFRVLKYYHLVSHFNPGFKHTLMIGGSGYSYPMDFLSRFPDAHIDVVEIDPMLTELAKIHFGLKDHPRLRIFHEDGRTFLNQSTARYDAIFMDAYKSQLTVPYQLTTLEAVEKMYQMLNPEGLVMANIISCLDNKRNHFLAAELATYKAVFPQVVLLAVKSKTQADLLQNFMLIAVKSTQEISFENEDQELDSYLQNVIHHTFPPIPVLTDDYAPVEFYANRLLSSIH